MSLYPSANWFREKYGPCDEHPNCPSQDCSKCTGEFCETHGANPCDCDVLDRHKIKNKENIYVAF